jgi:hypothetical protein
VFVDMRPIVERVLRDETDPSFAPQRYEDWLETRAAYEARPKSNTMQTPDAPPVGFVSEESVKRFSAKRRAEARLAERTGVQLDRVGEPDES